MVTCSKAEFASGRSINFDDFDQQTVTFGKFISSKPGSSYTALECLDTNGAHVGLINWQDAVRSKLMKADGDGYVLIEPTANVGRKDKKLTVTGLIEASKSKKRLPA